MKETGACNERGSLKELGSSDGDRIMCQGQDHMTGTGIFHVAWKGSFGKGRIIMRQGYNQYHETKVHVREIGSCDRDKLGKDMIMR